MDTEEGISSLLGQGEHLLVVIRQVIGVAPGQENQLAVAVDTVVEDPVTLRNSLELLDGLFKIILCSPVSGGCNCSHAQSQSLTRQQAHGRCHCIWNKTKRNIESNMMWFSLSLLVIGRSSLIPVMTIVPVCINTLHWINIISDNKLKMPTLHPRIPPLSDLVFLHILLLILV